MFAHLFKTKQPIDNNVITITKQAVQHLVRVSAHPLILRNQ